MTEPKTERCIAETRVKRGYTGNHTHRCQLEAGHEGGHVWTDDTGRSVLWFGEAKKMEWDTRHRWGIPWTG